MYRALPQCVRWLYRLNRENEHTILLCHKHMIPYRSAISMHYLTHRDWHPGIHVHVRFDNKALKVNVETTLTLTPRSNHKLDLGRPLLQCAWPVRCTEVPHCTCLVSMVYLSHGRCLLSLFVKVSPQLLHLPLQLSHLGGQGLLLSLQGCHL